MDQELKQKLIGAAVITALAAIFVPMLFDEPAEPEVPQLKELSIPEPPVTLLHDPTEGNGQPVPVSQSTLPTPYEQHLANQAAIDELDSSETSVSELSTEERQAEPPDFTPAATTASDTSPAKVTPSTDTDSKITGLAPPPPPPQAISKSTTSSAGNTGSSQKPALKGNHLQEHWLLQVASFTDRNYAERLVNKLKQAGYSAVTQPSGKVFRVKISPIPSATQAQQLKTEIDRLARTNSLVRRVAGSAKTASPAPQGSTDATDPPGNLVRWYLQLGSFSNQDSALKLQQQLRQLGFPAQLDPINQDGGRLYRLRVGPELDKDRARAALQKIEQQTQLKGFLVSD
ncbi:MAG: SPOR domain-containing protein [Methylococcales bacterium]|nr:SPOR domain-containing protein [Methylococcales bacterium]